MKKDELKRCLQRLNMSYGALAKLIGCRDLSKMSHDQARCVRALVLKEDIRTLVFQWHRGFPDLQFTAIRTLDDAER
jgi:hypothetical protein